MISGVHHKVKAEVKAKVFVGCKAWSVGRGAYGVELVFLDTCTMNALRFTPSPRSTITFIE